MQKLAVACRLERTCRLPGSTGFALWHRCHLSVQRTSKKVGCKRKTNGIGVQDTLRSGWTLQDFPHVCTPIGSFQATEWMRYPTPPIEPCRGSLSSFIYIMVRTSDVLQVNLVFGTVADDIPTVPTKSASGCFVFNCRKIVIVKLHHKEPFLWIMGSSSCMLIGLEPICFHSLSEGTFENVHPFFQRPR